MKMIDFKNKKWGSVLVVATLILLAIIAIYLLARPKVIEEAKMMTNQLNTKEELGDAQKTNPAQLSIVDDELKSTNGQSTGSEKPSPIGNNQTTDSQLDQMAQPPFEAIYIVEYNLVWSKETHPNTLPVGAHVSPMVVISHKNNGDLFKPKSISTDGVEIMAETGATRTLLDEVVEKSSVLAAATGSSFSAPGTNSLEIEVNQDHSLISFVSMLAPSPDWFIAINDVDLFKNNHWAEEIELNVKPYDAGTDSGTTFTATDSDTNPADVVQPPTDEQFVEAATENVFAVIKLKLKQQPSE